MMPITDRSPIHGAQLFAASGQDRERDADEAVGSELQQDRGQEHRTDRRRLGVRIGQPRVEREHRHLDREADEQAAEDQQLRAVHHPRAGRVRQQDHVEGVPDTGNVDLEVERQERQQHQRRAEQREQEELDRRVLAVRTAPHADHEEHREQDDLEEDEEQDQVLRDERAVHPDFEDQQQREERLGVVRLGEVVPRVDDAQHGDERRQGEHRQGDAVDRDVVVAVDDVDPVLVDVELQRCGLGVVELEERRDREPEGGEGRDERDLFDRLLLLAWDEHHDDRADGREEDHEGQRPGVEPGMHLS